MPESGPSQFGRVRDDWGNWFGVQNSWPLWHYVLADRYLRRNPTYAAPDPRVQVRAPGNPRVFPNKSIQKRYHSFDQSGRFTSACGPSIYRDELLFSREPNVLTAFTCEPFHNLVQRHRVTRNGVSFKGQRANDGDRDFFASADRWCRPVMSRTGPDGGLYIVDMYRYMIEHPDWLPPEGREELKPFYRSGDDRGRIYRIRKKGVPLREVPRLPIDSEEELFKLLAHPNGIVRDLVHRRILGQWMKSVSTLERIAIEHTDAIARLHALCVLDGKSKLTPEVLIAAMADQSANVRRHAARIAESRAGDHSETVRKLVELTDDDDASVRLQAILSLGEINSAVAGAGLVAAAQDPANDDEFFRAAIMSSAPAHLEALAVAVVQLPRAFSRPLIALAWGKPEIVSLLGATGVESVRGLELAGDYFEIMDERGGEPLNVGAESADKLHDLVAVTIPSIVDEAGGIVADRSRTLENRTVALRLLGRLKEFERRDLDVLVAILRSVEEPETLRLAALDRLFANTPNGAAQVFDWYPHLPASMRGALVNKALRRNSTTESLLDYVKDGHIPAISISPSQRQQMLGSKNRSIRVAANECFAPLVKKDRGKLITTLSESVKGLTDTGTGKATFEVRCASCHSTEDSASRVGPDLRSITDRSVETLLTALIDPNRAVDPIYVGMVATLKNGESLYGRVQSETGASYHLLLADGTTRRVARNSVFDIKLAPNSLMPEGLEAGLSSQQLADLLHYIGSLADSNSLDRSPN